MARSQTVTFLRERFAEIGIQPDSRRGQNFLIDLNLLRLLADAAQLDRRDVVLEVGTGTGALTELSAERAGAVVSVEVDRHLHQLASELLIDFDNVTLLQIDALRNKNSLHRRVIETVAERMQTVPEARLKLVANLPYCIATPIISNLLSSEIRPATMTATIQKELADRIVARPGNRDYGSLSIWIQAQCHVEIVRDLAPTVFWPRPKVHSSILQIVVDESLRRRLPDPHYFHQFVRAMFIHRRKFLRANLVAAMKRHLDKSEVDQVLADSEFGPDVRSEQVDVETMIAFCERVRRRAPDWSL